MITDITENIAKQSQTDEIKRIFNLQKANYIKVGQSTAKERIAKLNKLHNTVLKYRQEIRDAMYNDYKKPAAEVDLTEIYVISGEIKHAKSHIKRWMRPKKVATPIAFLGSSSWIQYESKGVCLIISPWNYPLQLAFGPLISAIAAGNTVILKPSEHTPHVSAIMRKIIEEVFEENEVAIFEGAVETATALLSLPFNHIFFTGAPEIGKVVMTAAAKNLTSVTLELGGKSPTIIDQTADIKGTLKRLAWGKFSNCGQICIAPDYVLVHESRHDEFVAEMKKLLFSFYGEDPMQSEAYMRMVNNHHFHRVKSYLDDSVAKGGQVVIGGRTNSDENYIEPTVVTDVPLDSDLMEKEIFGPVLPVIPFKDLTEVTALINAGEKPLALYIYSKSKKNIKYIMKNTRAGGTCINNSDVHFFNNNLPFGGSNNSGIGKSHGRFGFEAFSEARSVLKQNLPGALELLLPPYTDLKMKLINLTIKWF